MSKQCGDCKQLKLLSEFHKRGKGHQSVCKFCRKERDKGRKYDATKKRLIQKRFQEWRTNLKKNIACFDCKQIFHPVVMEWDHLPEFTKTKDVSSLQSRKLVLQEIKKCELVCANCHRLRTLKRNDSLV